MDLLLFVLDLRPEAAELLGLDKELHLKARDTTALKRCKGPVINDVSLISLDLGPPPPCRYQIHATSLLLVSNWLTPLLLEC